MTAEKGPDDAINIARSAGLPLRIAAKLPRGETAYFKKHIEPHIDDKTVQLVGEVDDSRKRPFLNEAAALLFPIDWPEPFGLVMIEALACGTYRAGSMSEVIEQGVMGLILDNAEQAIHAIRDRPGLGPLDSKVTFNGIVQRREREVSRALDSDEEQSNLLIVLETSYTAKRMTT